MARLDRTLTIFSLFIFSTFFGMYAFAAEEKELTPAMENPGHQQVPDWFKVSFLDLDEDVDEASQAGKRLMVYFFQDGCPYCKKLLEDNFGQRSISEKAQKYFDVVPLNIWGDREVSVGDKVLTEKEFAAALKVQYTPTLLFFNENKKVVFRANGYYPPEKFSALLDYVGERKEKSVSYQDYMAKSESLPTTGKLHTNVINIKDPGNLQAALEPGKYLLVLFEQKQCSACDELHLDILTRDEGVQMLKRFKVALFDMWSNQVITTPTGNRIKINDWAKQLDIKYAPSLVYFNDKGEEVFRSDAYLKAFHNLSVMDYVSSGAYKTQPNFQRYIDSRADRIRESGEEVILMQ